MKRLLVCVLAGVIVLAGCSSSKKTYSANGATVTTDTSQDTVTVQSSEGTEKIGKNVVDAASLGVPIYAGATQDEGGFSVSGAKGSAQMTSFTTPDSFEKVYAYYHSKMPAGSEKMKVGSGDDGSIAEFVIGGEKPGDVQTVVMITPKGKSTAIVVTKGKDAK